MKNEGLKQANTLVNWLEMNDNVIDDISITLKMKNDTIFKIMSDGSILKISSTTNKNNAFANAAEAISNAESKTTTDSTFKIQLPIERIKAKHNLTDDDIKSFFNDMTVDAIDDNVAFLTYEGNKEEEPETIAIDIQHKYGVRPISIKHAK